MFITTSKERVAEEFHSIDTLFAKKIASEATVDASWTLAYLLKKARAGSLCVSLFEDARLMKGCSELPKELFENFLVLNNNRLYLRRNWECENKFLEHFARLSKAAPTHFIDENWLKEHLQAASLNSEQKNAIYKASKQTLTLITGGPGTGKTFTAALLIKSFLKAGLREIAVAAPTGKATANLRMHLSSLGERCRIQTLHALLKKEFLMADLILVDEGSMIDAPLMARLFQAVASGSRLVLLGDEHQLPPVESGCFFSDLAEHSVLTAPLKKCLRTDLHQIIEWANRVKEGKAIPCEPLPAIQPLLKRIMDESWHVLTPLRKGPYGVDALNQALYLEHKKIGATAIPIMVTVNDSLLELFNGDMGTLDQREGRAHFSGGQEYAEYLLPRYEFAYAMSVHKSQGSEYEKVLILLPPGAEVFGREMLYTAITRAKKEVAILAHTAVVEEIVKKRVRRLSALGAKNW